jgi:carboxypeptidase C (cathepsin A)
VSLGVSSNIDYIDGNPKVYEAFAYDISTSYSSDVVVALNNIKVLIFNGQDDLVVNTAGVLQYINGLNWAGINAWKRAKKNVWTIHG